MKTLRKTLLTLVLVLVGVFGLTSCGGDKSSSSVKGSESSSVVVSESSSVVDTDQVAADAAAGQVILTQNKNKSQVADFTVPSKATIEGTEVALTWASSSAAAVIGDMDDAGLYTVSIVQQSADEDVILTVTATLNGKTATHEFNFRVPASNVITSHAAFDAVESGAIVTLKGVIADVDEGYNAGYGNFGYVFIQLEDDDADTLTQIYRFACTAEQAETDILVGATITVTGERAEYGGNIQLKNNSTYKLIKGLDAGQITVNNIVAGVGNPFEAVSQTEASTTTVTTTVADDTIVYSSDSSYFAFADGVVTLTPPVQGIADITISMSCTKDGYTGTVLQNVTLGLMSEATLAEFMTLDDYTEVMVTGKIVSVDSDYDSGYKSQTVTIQVGDNTGDTLELKYLKVATAELSASDMVVGNVITATGPKRSYTNDDVTTVQLKSGTYVLANVGADEGTEVTTMAALTALDDGAIANVTAKITSIKFVSTSGGNAEFNLELTDGSLNCYKVVYDATVDPTKVLVGATVKVVGPKAIKWDDSVVFDKNSTFTITEEAPADLTAALEAADTLVNALDAVYVTAPEAAVTLTTVPDGFSVVYTSDSAYVAIADGVATVTVPEMGVMNVVITATITKGDYTATTTFNTLVGFKSAPVLYISTYYEGPSVNKIIVLTNSSDAVLMLTGYTLELHGSGAAAASQTLDLAVAFPDGIAAGGTIAIYNSAVSQEAAQALIDGATLSVVDNKVANFNGDDPVVLSMDGMLIDVIGTMGDVDFGKDVSLTRIAAPTEGVFVYAAAEWTLSLIHI